MHIDVPFDQAAAFAAARDKAIRTAIKGGVRPIRRPQGLKLDEIGSEILPMSETDLRTGLTVGQMVWVNKEKLCPFDLQPEDGSNDPNSLGVPTPYDVRAGYVLCFVRVSFVGQKCRLTCKYAMLAYAVSHGFEIDARVPPSENTFSNRTMPSPKVILLPLECLEPVKN
jgi:hypothetical protein